MTDSTWGIAERARANAEARQVREEGQLRDTTRRHLPRTMEDLAQLIGEGIQDDMHCDWDPITAIFQVELDGEPYWFRINKGEPPEET